MTSFWQTCENLKSPITRMTTKFNTRKLISNFILFENLKINYFFLLFCFHKRTVLRNLVSITATSFCLKFTLAYIVLHDVLNIQQRCRQISEIVTLSILFMIFMIFTLVTKLSHLSHVSDFSHFLHLLQPASVACAALEAIQRPFFSNFGNNKVITTIVYAHTSIYTKFSIYIYIYIYSTT